MAKNKCCMKTKLAPIENPSSLIMKLVYWISRKKYGKVMTPLKVISARLPMSFGMYIDKLEKLDKSMSCLNTLPCLSARMWHSLTHAAFVLTWARWRH